MKPDEEVRQSQMLIREFAKEHADANWSAEDLEELLNKNIKGVYSPYLSKLTSENLEKICKHIFVSYNHLNYEEKEHKKQQVKDAIYVELQKTGISIPPSKQQVILQSLLTKLESAWKSLDEMDLTCNRTELPSSDDPYWSIVMARNTLFDVMQQPDTDRINGFIADLHWVKECTSQAVQNIKNKINSKGKQPDPFVEGLLIPLANVYYSMTDYKEPKNSLYFAFSGKDNTSKGRVVDTISEILNVFGCSRNARWIVDQLNFQLSQVRTGEEKYAHPLWLESKPSQ